MNVTGRWAGARLEGHQKGVHGAENVAGSIGPSATGSPDCILGEREKRSSVGQRGC